MKKDDNIEDLFKKSFDNYEPEVRPKVWENVKVGLKWGSLGMFLNALMNKVGTTTLIAIATSVVAIIGTYSVIKMNKDENSSIADNTTTALAIAIDSNKQSKQNIPVTSESVTTNAVEPNNINTTVDAGENSNAVVVDESLATISANMLKGTVPLIVDLSNTGTGKTHKWIFSNSKKTSTVSNPVHVFESPGKYSVKLISTDAAGKQDVDIVSVEVIESTPIIYQFSPNGDNSSDTLKLAPKGAVASIDAKIFDLDGNLIYKTDETKGAYWNGKDLQGNDSPKGNYYLTLNATTPKGKKVEQKGIVKLVK